MRSGNIRITLARPFRNRKQVSLTPNVRPASAMLCGCASSNFEPPIIKEKIWRQAYLSGKLGHEAKYWGKRCATAATPLVVRLI